MKLYYAHHAIGLWQLPGQQEKGATRVDLPDRAPELAVWLNERQVPLHFHEPRAPQLSSEPQLADQAEGAQPATGNPARCRICRSQLSATEAGAEKSAVSADLDRIVDWITAAPDWALNQLTEAVLNRGREIAGANKQ